MFILYIKATGKLINANRRHFRASSGHRALPEQAKILYLYICFIFFTTFSFIGSKKPDYLGHFGGSREISGSGRTTVNCSGNKSQKSRLPNSRVQVEWLNLSIYQLTTKHRRRIAVIIDFLINRQINWKIPKSDSHFNSK